MGKLNQNVLLCVLIVSMSSCRQTSDGYAIKDFNTNLQPFLQEVVTAGLVTFQDPKRMKLISDKELVRLSSSENPIIRATATLERLKRNKFKDVNLLLSRLDDTAMVAIDEGEFGMAFRTVSDYLVRRTYWEMKDQQELIEDRLLTRHNYLSFAFEILQQMEPNELYYDVIKDMATRPRRVDSEGYEEAFDEIEYALFGLAKFRKPGDIIKIKQLLLTYYWRLSSTSFRLMTDYPDSSYFDVLRKYHNQQFYQFSGFRPHGFTGFPADRAAPEVFISALLAQQTTASAQLVDTMLNRLNAFPCMPDRDSILEFLIEEIWESTCPAYVHLRARVKQQAIEISGRKMEVSW